jgi:16S rRNA pseudouridine516 synthase
MNSMENGLALRTFRFHPREQRTMSASPHSPTKRRIDQLLSSCGYCSRSDARLWVKGGRVTVAGQVAKRFDEKVLAHEMRVDGEPVEQPEGLLAVFHKPLGCVCSRDEREGTNVYDLLPERWSGRNPPVSTVGRLDKDTTGVLLVTDQGDLLHRLTSPRQKVPKVYEVTFDGTIRPGLVELFAGGTLCLDDENDPCLPAALELIDATHARIEIVEGRFHQVRRMFGSQGLLVTQLHRSRFGDYSVDGLAPGEWRYLPLPE